MGLQHLSRQLAGRVLERVDALAEITDEPGCLTRTFLSPAMRRANKRVGAWMHEGGLEVREDAVFNLIGRLPSPNPQARTFILGSHLDTVRNAGKYDGALGVLLALAVAEELRAAEIALPFHLEVTGFADEEGVRYHTTYVGSRALAGTLTERDLNLLDKNHIALHKSGIGDVATAQRKKSEILGYAEVHIEQGRVLEAEQLSLGVVSAISGQTRARLQFLGRASHAGTTPMHLRRDALAAAAEFIVAVEKRAQQGVIATVGEIQVAPGASNVIPGAVTLSLDVRHQRDLVRTEACLKLRACAEMIAARRKLRVSWKKLQETATVACDERLQKLLRASVRTVQERAPLLASGAGHDAAALSDLCPVAMLFVRCKGGISHHPAESVSRADVAQAFSALSEFLLRLPQRHE